jgi:diaminohydroxyphosphoribosylaminopyrimidine deaminase / 5-amino-6-(5-phosphoribosylamino)uracil reductase
VTFSADDHRHMGRALELAARGLYSTDPNPRVGCVLVKNGSTVGEGWHERPGAPHAEALALAAAGARAQGATAYVTLEPCAHHGRTPPCAEALVGARVARVVCAGLDPNPLVNGQGAARLATAGIVVETGCLRAAAEALNPGFLSRFRLGRPFVRVKIASSLDGRSALADGASRWITGEAARADVQRLRARSSAVLTGAGTVRADDPRLTVRDPALAPTGRQPLRVVVGGTRGVPASAHVFEAAESALIYTADSRLSWARAAAARGVKVESVAEGESGRVQLAAVLSSLARREVNELLVEAGATLSGAFLAAGLVDELIIYQAPTLLGPTARPLADWPQLTAMDQRPRLRLAELRQVGADLRLTLVPVPAAERA